MLETGNDKPVRPARSVAVLATVFVAIFVANIDLFVVNVALPDVGHDFGGASLGSLSWVLNAYAIVFAALLVPAGRLADRHGQRGGFLLGLALFTAGSGLCAAAGGVGYLVAARVLQASGAAMLLPTSLALIMAIAAPERRAAMVRVWSVVGSVAAALGPVLGGLLVQASWRWVFLINVPVGLVTLAVGLRVLPTVRGEASGRGPDLLGASLLTVSIGALSLGLVKGGEWGWDSGRIVGSFVASAVLLVVFLLQSRRHPAPVVEMALLRIGRFRTANIALLVFGMSFAAEILSVALWCQNVWGYSALRTGLALAPGPLIVPPVAILSGRLSRRFGPGPASAVGILVFAFGVWTWSLNTNGAPNYATGMLPGFLIGGIGVGIALPTLTAAGTMALPPQRLATGSGLLTMARQVGAVLGVAVLIGVIGTPHTVRATVDAYHHGWDFVSGVCLLAAAAALTLKRPASRGVVAESVAQSGRESASAG
jgi:EmrB/QacA subfamily drug resistance transporter